MDANNKVPDNNKPDVASPQPASSAEPPKTFGLLNLGLIDEDMPEDQLCRFMFKTMALNSSSEPKVGSFARCTSRFYGTRSGKHVETFIFNVMLYKDIEGIDDETALHELPLLLEDEAATWWAGISENVYNWSEALKMLQKEFSPQKPVQKIYTEMFATKQDAHIPSEIFIRQKLALLNTLPQPPPENIQIDMIYTVMKSKIQKKVPRESIGSIDQLIAAANRVEHEKNEERMRRFVNFNFKTMRASKKSEEKCSHCRKYKGSDMNCYKCNSLRRKLSEDGEQYNHLTAANVSSLNGFNRNRNPFRK